MADRPIAGATIAATKIVGKNKTYNEASLVPEDSGGKPAPHPEACLLSIPG